MTAIVNSPSMEVLVDDVLDIILSHLSLQDWLRLESVSRSWAAILRSQWRRVRELDLASLLRLPKFHPCIAQLYTPTFTYQHCLKAADKIGGNLRSVTTGGAEMKLELGIVDLLATRFPKLESLDLSMSMLVFAGPPEEDEMGEEEHLARAEAWRPAGVFPALKRLTLDKTFTTSAYAYHGLSSVDPLLFKLFASVPELEELSLGQNTMLSGACLLGLPSRLSRLGLDFCRRISSETLCLAFAGLPHLRHVSFYSCSKLTGACLSALPAELESVDVSFCDALEEDSVVAFVKGHRRLRDVQMSHLDCLSDAVLEALARLSGLERLGLNSYFRDSPVPSKRLEHGRDVGKGTRAIAGLASLRSLDLSQNDFVDDGVLVKLAREAPGLRELHLAQVHHCTEVGFASLGRLSDLRHLDVSGNDAVDEHVLQQMSMGGRLETVKARNCRRVKEAEIRGLASLWPTPDTVFFIF